MGSDMLFMQEDQARIRSAYAQKVSQRIRLELMYKPEAMTVPIEDMSVMYAGTVRFVGMDNIEHIISMPKYEEAVILYRAFNKIKKDLS